MSLPGLSAFESMLDPRQVPNRLGLLMKHLASASQKPLDLYNAIAGVGPRAELGAVAGQNPVKAVLQPGKSLETTHAAERRVGLPVNNSGIGQFFEDVGTETLADPAFQAGVVASATGSPEIGIPLDLISLGTRAARAARLGTRLEDAFPWVRRFADWGVHEQGTVHRATTRAGQDVVKGHESAGRNVRTRQRAEHEEVVGANVNEMNAPEGGVGHIPPAVRHKIMQRAYREGTAGVRRKVVKDGYTPTAEEAASKPLGILTNYRGPEYVPKQRLRSSAELLHERLPTPYRRIRQLAPKPGFNLPQRVGDETAPLSERVADRLEKGSRLEQYYRTRDNILTDLGLAPAASRPAEVLERLKYASTHKNPKAAERYRALLARQHAAVKDAELTRGKMLNPSAPLYPGTKVPDDVYQRLFGDVVRPNPSPLKDVSDASREALFALTSVPHKKNISVLQTLGAGGVPAIARGHKYAQQIKRGAPGIEDRTKALEGIGGTEHFVRNRRDVDDSGDERAWFERLGKPGKWVGNRAHAVGNALDRWDTGQRLALQDALAKKGITGFQAGGQIRDTLGDYKSKTQLVDQLRNIAGAPFPQWHLGIVPKAIGKAVVENPRATHALARTENLINQDITEPAFGADFNLGGPFDEGLGLGAFPFGTGQYVGSQSDLGLLKEVPRDLGYLAKGKVNPVASDLFRTYFPSGGIIQDLLGKSNFAQSIPPAGTAALNYFGSYLTPQKHKPPWTKVRESLRDELQWQGVPQPAIDAMMRRLQLKPKY